MEIIIPIKKRIAYSPAKKIVCGNSDYTIVFEFDEEWAQYPVKTARFSFDYKYIDVVFEGNACPCPVILDALVLTIGVFAGELRTTTPALIGCKKSILCEDGSPADPPEDVYNQIMTMLNNGFAPKLESAAVGQTVIVKSIDENGRPTEWEAVDLPDEGEGVLPSVDEEDNGKILKVVGGKWKAEALPIYEGAYAITPSINEDQTLLTAQRFMDADVKIEKIPYSEVSNNSGGVTVNIGG